MTIYHIHGPKIKGGMYSVCEGDPNTPGRRFSSIDHECHFEHVTFTKWGAKIWIKRQLKKEANGPETPFWDLPIVGAYTSDPGKEAETSS